MFHHKSAQPRHGSFYRAITVTAVLALLLLGLNASPKVLEKVIELTPKVQ